MARPGKFRSAAIERGRKRADARSNREKYMATQGQNIVRGDVSTDKPQYKIYVKRKLLWPKKMQFLITVVTLM